MIMKQLDIDVSPPANIMSFRPALTLVTFDLDPGDSFRQAFSTKFSHISLFDFVPMVVSQIDRRTESFT